MKKKKAIAVFGIPIIFLIAVMLKNFWISISEIFPECIFLKVTGYFCPACGNTRCVLSLLRGDFLSAIKNNITIPVLFVFLLMLYAELVLNVIHRANIRIIPRKKMFWIIFAIIMIVYYIARNFVVF